MKPDKYTLIAILSLILVSCLYFIPLGSGISRVPGTDYLLCHLPAAKVWVDSWRNGVIPIINPLCNLGEPFLAVPSNQPLYPLKAVLLPFHDLSIGMGFMILIHFLLTGLTLVPWCMKASASRNETFTIITLMITSPAILAWSAMHNEFCALPWAFATMWPIISAEKSRFLSFITGSIVIRALTATMTFLAGSPELALFSALTILAGSLMESFARSPSPWFPTPAKTLAIITLAALMASPAWVPFINWVPLSARALESAALKVSVTASASTASASTATADTGAAAITSGVATASSGTASQSSGFLNAYGFNWNPDWNWTVALLISPGPLLLLFAFQGLFSSDKSSQSYRNSCNPAIRPLLLAGLPLLTALIFQAGPVSLPLLTHWTIRYPGKLTLLCIPMLCWLAIRGLKGTNAVNGTGRATRTVLVTAALISPFMTWHYCSRTLEPASTLPPPPNRDNLATAAAATGKGLTAGSTWRDSLLPLDSRGWEAKWVLQAGPGYLQTNGIAGPLQLNALPSRMQWWSALMLSTPRTAASIPPILGIAGFFHENLGFRHLKNSSPAFIVLEDETKSMAGPPGKASLIPHIPKTFPLDCIDCIKGNQTVDITFHWNSTIQDKIKSPPKLPTDIIIPMAYQPGIRAWLSPPPRAPLQPEWLIMNTEMGPLGTSRIKTEKSAMPRSFNSSGIWQLKVSVNPFPWNSSFSN